MCNTNELIPLERAENRGYLQQQIPAPRDDEIAKLLLTVIRESRFARFSHALNEGHAVVLRVFAERMATAAVRNNDANALELAMISLLLSWRSPDCRETLVVFPVLYDAMRRLGVDVDSFVTEIRQVVGDQRIEPLTRFLDRSERNKSLAVMGYTVGIDTEGFRYMRNW